MRTYRFALFTHLRGIKLSQITIPWINKFKQKREAGKIPFDVAGSVGWAESATQKESATPKINPSATRGRLKTRRGHFECNGATGSICHQLVVAWRSW